MIYRVPLFLIPEKFGWVLLHKESDRGIYGILKKMMKERDI